MVRRLQRTPMRSIKRSSLIPAQLRVEAAEQARVDRNNSGKARTRVVGLLRVELLSLGRPDLRMQDREQISIKMSHLSEVAG
ncbi:hypothetical protein [Bradyrhizobium sp. CCBAU 11386]|uniref:hypothetical protein n=1 Tax=Bradyrhizobium sp. CCBAU 11386 TaxID=1630837 RepID=UPI002302961B|nr:hypothetical protein [Bradyrhizobium sp. CCBAU 11386]